MSHNTLNARNHADGYFDSGSLVAVVILSGASRAFCLSEIVRSIRAGCEVEEPLLDHGERRSYFALSDFPLLQQYRDSTLHPSNL